MAQDENIINTRIILGSRDPVKQKMYDTGGLLDEQRCKCRVCVVCEGIGIPQILKCSKGSRSLIIHLCKQVVSSRL